MRISGKLLATTLAKLCDNLEVGMTTKDLSEIAKHELRGSGGQPTFLGYLGFPDVICVSINEEVVHGIPNSKRIIKNGDLVSIDFGVTYDGLITDAATTVIAGNSPSKKDQALLQTTKASLDAGISVVKDGIRVGDIGDAVQKVLEQSNYGIVKDFVGHGVGYELHEEPNIPNYGVRKQGTLLKSGMTIAIEPMATLGGFQVYIGSDGWTVRTKDGSRAAHFEHTVLIHKSGAEILTLL